MSTINGAKKPRGRPPVEGIAINVRVQQPILSRIEAYASNRNVNRPEAVRQLIAIALDGIPAVAAEIERMEASSDEESLATAARLRDILGRR